MFPSWRMQLGEARRAMRRGQLDRAGAIVKQEHLCDFRQARELSQELVRRFAQRAEGRMLAGHSTAGWHDLQTAQDIAGCDTPVVELREHYRNELLERACRYLAEGRTTAARQELEKARQRRLADEEIRRLAEVTTRLGEAEQMLEAGNAAEARQTLDHVGENLAGGWSTINTAAVAERVGDLVSQCAEHHRLSTELLAATDRRDWHEVLDVASQALALAPRDRVARAARRKAWNAVGLDATHRYEAGNTTSPQARLSLRNSAATRHCGGTPPSSRRPMTTSEKPNRMMLWVDAVGGFLVCLDDEVVLGQPAPDAPIAVPLCADLSRRHAVLRREGGTYTIEPLGDVTVDGRPLTGPMVLGDRHVLQLGSVLQLRFEKPHALSATARLTPISGHRTEPRADAVLLMADSCLLGPKSHSHIVCRRWPGDLMLFRQQGRLFCRSTLSVTIDGMTADGAAPLGGEARIEGDEFALSLEEV